MNMKKLFRSLVSMIMVILCVIGSTPTNILAAGTYTLHYVDDLQNTDALYKESFHRIHYEPESTCMESQQQ